MARRMRGKTRTCAGWGHAPGSPVSVSGTLLFLIQDVDGVKVFGLFMFLRIARAPAQNVTDRSFVEQGVNQRGRSHRGQRVAVS